MVSVTPDNTDVVHLVHNGFRNYKTIDGGKSWERITMPSSICGFDSDVIFNPKNNQEALCSPDRRKIYKSSDGGVNWFLFTDNEGEEGILINDRNLSYSSDGKKSILLLVTNLLVLKITKL